jgi:tRNA pseudouridine38-40 synthase
MRTLKVTLAYDGTRYFGWQVQNQEPTLQSTIEAAFKTVTGTAVRVTASGRTDAGVHALGQVLSVRVDSQLSDDDLARAIQANTPHDIFIHQVKTVHDTFHAIREARRKRYRYVIQHGRSLDIFDRLYAWHIYWALDVPAMRQAASHFLGENDFASFQASGSDRKTTVRTIYDLTMQSRNERGAEKLDIEIEADGFLYNMVRNMVGTLVEVGRAKRAPDSIPEVIAARNRIACGPTAPAHGLFLLHVEY